MRNYFQFYIFILFRLDAISIGGLTFDNNTSQIRNVQRQLPVNGNNLVNSYYLFPDKNTDIMMWQRNSQIGSRSNDSVNSTMSPPSISGSSILKESRLNLVDVDMARGLFEFDYFDLNF
jgi:hypothetical protein